MLRKSSVVLVVIGVLWSATVLAEPTQHGAALRNGLAHLSFDETSGALQDWTDLSSGVGIIDPSPDTSLWTVQFEDATLPHLTLGEAKRFTFEKSSDQSITLRWTDFGRSVAPDLAVLVAVSLGLDSPVARWSMAIEGLADLAPARVIFPSLSSIPEREGESLAVPVWMGEQTTRFRQMLNRDGKGARFGWEYPGLLSMQCAVFEQPSGPGLYIAMDDTKALRKHVDFFGDGNGAVGVEITHYIESFDRDRRSYNLPYTVSVGANHGDWYDAAERYRDWALDQHWAKNSRLRAGHTPDWVRETGLWVWNRGRSENVLSPALALQEQTGFPVSVFWHWWHGCSYDSGFPEYLPPREGAEPFAQALAAAHEKNIRAMVYMNQRLWSIPTESWKSRGAERFAVKQQDGTIRHEVYNTFTKAPNASMCIGTEFWRDTYADIAEEAYNTLGIDAIYMDQACSSLACYDATHGHVLGGGAFWMDGFRKLSSDIRERCVDRGGIALAGEGCGEAWLPYLDIMLSLQVSMERYANPGDWSPIPFFHAVYHGYGIFYGNYASLTMPPYDELWPKEFAPKEPLALLDRKFARQFRMEHARSFIWGQQPTVANFRPSHLQDRAEEMNFVIELAKLRKAMTKYLQKGTMLRPPTFTAPMATLNMSRLSIYAGQQGALREFQREYPLVLAAAWRAPDQSIAIAIANIDDAPQTVELNLPEEWNLREPAEAYRTDHSGRVTLEEIAAGKLHLTLPPRNASIVEFADRIGTR